MKISKKNKLTMVAIIGLGLFNPFTVAVLDEYFRLAYTAITVVSAVWLMGYVVYSVTRPEAVNIPKKAKKTKKDGMVYES